MHTTAEREIVRTIKEKCCYIALNPAKEEKETSGRNEEFKLPDGSSILVRSSAPRAAVSDSQNSVSLVQNGSAHLRSSSTQNSSAKSSQACTKLSWTPSTGWISTSARICSRILCSVVEAHCAEVRHRYSPAFANTNLVVPGFGDRLLNEVKKLALKDVKIKIYAPPERKYSTWIGGSILAGLNTFKKVRQYTFRRVVLPNCVRRCGCRRRNTRRIRMSSTRNSDSNFSDSFGGAAAFVSLSDISYDCTTIPLTVAVNMRNHAMP